MADVGRMLMVAGAGLFILGAVLMVAGRIPWLGQLPGDVTYQRGNMTIFAPIGTMIVISIVLTIVINVLARLLR